MQVIDKIAVIMTVHNRRDKTIFCLKSLYNSLLDGIHLSVFLTDDGSTDNTSEEVNKLFPDVNILSGDGTLFWNRGMELAWLEARKEKFDYYLWLNDDTILFNDSIINLLKLAQANINTIVVGSTVDYKNEISYGGRTNDYNHSLIKPNPNIAIPCDTFNGNIVLIPSIIVNKIGVNAHFFRHSFGDIEYGLRAQKMGFKSIIAPGIYGKCDRNFPIPKFMDSNISLIKRLNILYSPLGFNPNEAFYIDFKYKNLIYAFARFIKVHLNVIFPSFFMNNQK